MTARSADLARNPRGIRAAVALALSALLALTMSLVSAAPAHAAADVQIDNVYFESSVIEDGTRQALNVDWSIPAQATNPVSLSVELPEGLEGYTDRFDMIGPGGTIAGECVVTATDITCTVDPDFIDANPYGVSGSFWFNVSVDLRNQETTEQTFDFGGQQVPVTVEPNADYCDEVCEFTGYRFKKYGSYNSLDDIITWTVRLPAPEQGIPADSNIVITDQLDEEIFELVTEDEGETWPQLWEARCLRLNSSNEEAPRWLERSTADWNADMTEVSFVSRAGNSPDGSSCVTDTTGSFYQVVWKVKVKDLGKAGTYENSATYSIDGVTSDATTGTATRRSGGGDVDGTNFGSFSVTKQLDGDTVLNPTFTVGYEAYDDSLGPTTPYETGTFEIKSGQTYTSTDFFKGTRVVLTEVQPSEPANVTWAAPVFLDADGRQLTEVVFSEENANLGTPVEITLVNEATLRTGEITARKVVDNPDGLDIGTDAFRIGYAREQAIDKGIQNLVGGQFILPADGTAVTLPNMPGDVGYRFFEWFTPSPAGTSWADPVYTVNGVEIAENALSTLPIDGSIDLVVTNRITQDLGGFTLTKSVSGEGASLVPAGTEFQVDYAYTSVNGFDGGEGSVIVTAGETAAVEGIPAGAVVTLTEVAPIDPIGGTWGEPQFDLAEFPVVNGQNVAVSLDNPITWNTGSFSVVKAVEGDGAGLVAEDATFGVDYTYTLPADLGGDTGSGSLVVSNDGTAVSGDALPYGTEVTLTEEVPPAVAGATWTGSSFDPATFTVGDGTTVEVTLTNTIERDLGAFSVAKTVSGSGAHLVAADATFTIEYSYPGGDGFAAGSGAIEVPADGSAVIVADIPAAAVVTLSEVAPAAVPGGSWQPAVFPEGNILTVVKDQTVAAVVENVIDLNRGAFSLAKLIDGTGADLVDADATFTVEYSYPAGDGFEAGTGTLVLSADGAVVTSDALPYGAVVSFSELTPADVEGAEWTDAVFSADTVTIGDGDVFAVTLTNTLTADEETPDPGTDGTDDGTVDGTDDGSGDGTDDGAADGTDASDDSTDATEDDPALPATGVNSLLLLLIPAGLALLVGGALMFVIRGRREVDAV